MHAVEHVEVSQDKRHANAAQGMRVGWHLHASEPRVSAARNMSDVSNTRSMMRWDKVESGGGCNEMETDRRQRDWAHRVRVGGRAGRIS